jgi:hypothetical protein
MHLIDVKTSSEVVSYFRECTYYKTRKIVGYGTFTAVAMERLIVWDATLCRALLPISFGRVSCVISFFDPEDGGEFLRNVSLLQRPIICNITEDGTFSKENYFSRYIVCD